MSGNTLTRLGPLAARHGGAWVLALAASAAWAVPDPSDDPLGQFLAARAGEAPQAVPVAPAEVGRAGDKAADMVLAALNFLDVPYRRGGP